MLLRQTREGLLRVGDKRLIKKGPALKTKIIISGALAVLLWSCATEVSSPPSVSHPPEWNTKTADNFHGNKVLADMASGYDQTGTASCQPCHGENYDGGKSGVACASCHPSFPHPSTWLDKDSEPFHGDVVDSLGTKVCEDCHGADLSGGISGVACSDCHSLFPHPSGWANPNSPNFHGVYISEDNWSLSSCTGCHGADYEGGSSGVSCTTCHAQTGGPEACNTCHGNFAGPVSNISNWAPPEDLEKETATTAKGVGAHQTHLNTMDLAAVNELGCTQCHAQLSGFDDPNHITGTVQLEWNPLATDSGRVTPVWSESNATCANVYCHGNFEFTRASSPYPWAYTDSAMTGNNPTLEWTKVGTGQAACGTCHELPPAGHFPQELKDCYVCHGTVVDQDLNIIDKTKHINGKIDLTLGKK
jgi:predicted CxxxxCH...CXXCH cytochrome family protein